MTIRRRLFFNSLISILLILIFILIQIYFFYERNIENDKLIYIIELNTQITDFFSLLEDYMFYQTLQQEQPWGSQYSKIINILDTADESYSEISYNFKEVETLFSRIEIINGKIDTTGQEDPDMQNHEQLHVLRKYLKFRLNVKEKKILQTINSLSKTSIHKLKVFSQYNLYVLSLYSLFIIIFLLTVVVSTYKNIVLPLNILVDKIHSIGRSMLTKKVNSLYIDIPTKVDREIHDLILDFNYMIERLAELYKEMEFELETRKIIEKDIINERERLTEILESLPDSIYMADSEYNIKYLTPVLIKEFGGYNGEKCYRYLHGRTEVCPWCNLSEVLSGKTVYCEWTSEKKGTKYEVVNIPLKNTDGTISMLHSMRDISKRKDAEEKLCKYRDHLEELIEARTSEIEKNNSKLIKSQKAIQFLLEDVNETRLELEKTNSKLLLSNKDLKAFTHSVSHDLRSPLRAVRSFTLKLKNNIADKADQETLRLLNIIVDNTEKMQDLIENLLLFSRLTVNKTKSFSIDLNKVVSSVIDEIKQEKDERTIQFTVEDLPKAFGNFTLIKQVYRNLIENAIKFSTSAHKAEVLISYSEIQGGAYFVKDNGIGFDNRLASKIFNIFSRGTNDKNIPGTGVGLAIVKRIVEGHGGHIWANSEPGEGAVFYFTLNS